MTCWPNCRRLQRRQRAIEAGYQRCRVLECSTLIMLLYLQRKECKEIALSRLREYKETYSAGNF